MVRIEPGLLFVQLLTFGLAVLVLWRFFWKPLAKFMDARRRGIEQDLEAARDSRAAAAELEQQYRQRLADIDDKAWALLQLAAEEGDKKRDELLREAQTEAKRLLDNAARQIAEEKVRAIHELRAETVALSMLIAEKALKQSVDPKVQSRLVDDFVRELGRG